MKSSEQLRRVERVSLRSKGEGGGEGRERKKTRDESSPKSNPGGICQHEHDVDALGAREMPPTPSATRGLQCIKYIRLSSHDLTSPSPPRLQITFFVWIDHRVCVGVSLHAAWEFYTLECPRSCGGTEHRRNACRGQNIGVSRVPRGLRLRRVTRGRAVRPRPRGCAAWPRGRPRPRGSLWPRRGARPPVPRVRARPAAAAAAACRRAVRPWPSRCG